jgi:hypothetical protein
VEKYHGKTYFNKIRNSRRPEIFRRLINIPHKIEKVERDFTQKYSFKKDCETNQKPPEV